MREFFAARPALTPTPVRPLQALAAELGVASLAAKDETARFGLNAFKLLGATFAIDTLRATGRLQPGQTVICASEGNHGRAVARAARHAGCAARVYMAHDAAQARVDAIAGEGAEVIRVSGSYDDAVRMLRDDAAAHGWTIVSDTAWEGYEEIPRLIMQGYSRMLDEVFGREPDAGRQEPDIVFVQGGVGGLLCGVANWCAMHRPDVRVVCVEPTSAACLQASARAGRPVAVTGVLNTAMAGLRNREVSPTAFAAVLPIVDAFVAIDDVWTEDAMRRLHAAGIDAGASGAAALGGLLAMMREPSMRDARADLGLNSRSRAMVIVSEGVTDPAHWSSIVGAA
jgi:diaminopropionate ammonia-lyase family